MLIIQCGDGKISLTLMKEESIKDSVIREFGWLLKPIIKETKSFENALDKLNWKIEIRNQ